MYDNSDFVPYLFKTSLIWLTFSAQISFQSMDISLLPTQDTCASILAILLCSVSLVLAL
jgi:hypothetical protein